MRVHQIINHFGLDRGGAERLARQLHLDLRAAGVDARLVGIEDCPTDGLEAARSLGLRSPYDPRAVARLAAYARAEIAATDVVHVHLFPASAHVAALARAGMVRAPCLFTEHSTLNRRRSRRVWRGLDRTIYTAFRRVAAISHGVQEALLAAHPGLAGRTEVILNGCALPFTEPPQRVRDGACPTILSIGRLTRLKNYATAIEALAMLGERPFRYVVLGEGEDRAMLAERVAALGLEHRVSFPGHREDIRPFLLDADLLLLPSLWEGFGLVAVEAMNAALPVVASDVPGLREVVGAPGDCASLADPTSAESVYQAVAALLDSPASRVEMGRRGFVRAARFDKARMTRAYVATYRQLAEAHLAHA